MNIKRIQAKEKFIDESFNAVIDDLDQKLLGIDHLDSGMHWTPWESGTSYRAGDVIRWPRLKSHQYAKCIQGGTSGANAPVVNTTGAEVSSGSTKWKIVSLTEVSDVKGGAISIWLGGGTLYERGDAVIYGKSIYRCKTASHYSSLSFQADIDNWQEVFASIRFWQPNTYYDIDDTVIVDGFIHICLASHTSQSTYNLSEKNNWKRMHDYAVIPEWEPSTRYLVNQVVTIDGILYVCTYDHISDSADVDVDEAYWNPLYASLQDWSAGTFYGVGATILYDNWIYKCTYAHVASSNFSTDLTNWTLLHQLPSKLYDWTPQTKYGQYQLVYHENNIYRSLFAHTSGANFDPTQWQIVSDSINDWISQGDYQVGQYVNYQGALYKCIINNNDTNFTIAKWQKISGGSLETWISNKDYSVGDIVINAGKIYQCNTAHTSSSSFNTDISSWTEISACITRIPNWAVSTDYVVGDLVAHDAKIYRCITAHTSESTWNQLEETKWEELSPTINEISTWSFSTDYAIGQLVIHNNKLYRCNTAHTSDSTSFNTDIAYWSEISGSGGIEPWKANELYMQGNMVVYNDKIYICDTAHTSTNNFDYTKWHEVSGTTVENWQSNTVYVENQPIEYNDTLFRANKDFTSGIEVSDDDNNMDFVYANLSTWKSGIYYRKGSIVIDSDDKIYRCKQSHTSSSANRDTNWEELSKTLVEEYAQNKNYAEGSPVLYRGKLYRANTDVTNSTATLDPNKWDNIVGSGIEQWQPSTDYSVGNVVVNNNQIYRCKTAHTSDSSNFSVDIAKWDVIDTKSFCNTWQTEHLYLKNELINIRSNWYKAKDSHVSCNTKFEDDFDDHWELIDKIDDWEAGKPYRIGTIVRKDDKLFKCTASTSSGVFDPNSWELYLKCVEDWHPNVNSTNAPLVYVDFEYTIDGTPYNYYSDVITGTIERHGGNWNVPQLGDGASLRSSMGSYTLSTPSHAINSSNSYTIEFIMVDHSYNNGNFAEPYNNHLYLNTDKSVYVYYLASPTHKLCVNIGTYSYEWEVAHNGSVNNFIHALAFTFMSTGTNLFVDGVLVLETDYVSSDITFNMHSESGFVSGIMVVDELFITKGVLYSSDYSPTYEPRDKPIGYSYKVGDLVVYDNNIYQCVKDNADGKFDYTKWKLLGNKGNGILDWNPTINYSEDDLVLYNDVVYRCGLEHTSTNNFNDDYDKWIPLDKNCFIHNWVSNIPYYVDEVVKYDDVLYRCKTSHVSTLNDKPSGAILYEATGNTLDIDDTTTIPYSEIIDLGSVKRITDIDYLESTIDMSFTYTIEVSEDNVSYTSWDGVPVDARYIRLIVDSVTIDAGATLPNAHLTDFTVYGDSNNWEKISFGGSAEIVLARKQDIDEMFI